MKLYKIIAWIMCHIFNRHSGEWHYHKKTGWQTRRCKDCGIRQTTKLSKTGKRIKKEVNAAPGK
jgi:hypothetical protein